jgi:hypothetical protein
MFVVLAARIVHGRVNGHSVGAQQYWKVRRNKQG